MPLMPTSSQMYDESLFYNWLTISACPNTTSMLKSTRMDGEILFYKLHYILSLSALFNNRWLSGDRPCSALVFFFFPVEVVSVSCESASWLCSMEVFSAKMEDKLAFLRRSPYEMTKRALALSLWNETLRWVEERDWLGRHSSLFAQKTTVVHFWYFADGQIFILLYPIILCRHRSSIDWIWIGNRVPR